MRKKIFIHVFGCRSSLCEGEYIAGTLKASGYEITEDINSEYNAAVIVTCSVTQEADRKCRSAVKRTRRVMAEGRLPGDSGILAVCGCWGQSIDKNEALKLGINILAGSRHKDILPHVIAGMIEGKTEKKFTDLRDENFSNESDRQSASDWEELEINSPVLHSRAFMKIQDGCNHFCTYCIIPFLRGRPVSRPVKNIIDEIKRLLDNGTKEIIFTGIHLGLYGKDFDFSLADLIREVSKIKELKRLRLGSLEPFCLDENLINTLAECESFCHHLHLPLQSGSNEILTSMRRGYKAGDFINVCEKVREKISKNIHISSDILIGFPGETEKDFNETLSVMKNAVLGRVHVFPYSERPGTLAAVFSQKVSHEEKILRTSRAISLGQKLYDGYAKKFVNHEVEILLESKGRGYTRHYVEAVCEHGENNKIIRTEALRYVSGRLEC